MMILLELLNISVDALGGGHGSLTYLEYIGSEQLVKQSAFASQNRSDYADGENDPFDLINFGNALVINVKFVVNDLGYVNNRMIHISN